jgi:hypothetical protein
LEIAMRAIHAALAAALLASSAASWAQEPSTTPTPSKAESCAQEAHEKTQSALDKVRANKRWASWSVLERYAARDAAGAGRSPQWESLSPEAISHEAEASRRRVADDRALAASYGQEAKAATGAPRAAAYERQAFWNAMAAIDSTGTSFSSCMARKGARRAASVANPS